jgi:hypothetical protein
VHEPPGHPGILTTTQQFGIVSGVAVIGAVFYGALGNAATRAGFVSSAVVTFWVNLALLALAAALTFVLPATGGTARRAG